MESNVDFDDDDKFIKDGRKESALRRFWTMFLKFLVDFGSGILFTLFMLF